MMLIKHSDQNCLHAGAECDYCGNAEGTTYNERYAVIAQGATGRWCEVMWICDACGNKSASQNPHPVMSPEEARKEVTNPPHSWPEF